MEIRETEELFFYITLSIFVLYSIYMTFFALSDEERAYRDCYKASNAPGKSTEICAKRFPEKAYRDCVEQSKRGKTKTTPSTCKEIFMLYI